MKRSSDLNLGQTMMAANAPMMIQHSMVDGHVEQGIMPSGQIAGTIDDLPSVEDLISSIVKETKEVVSELAEMNKAHINQ
jgi:NAD(P)H-dependent flavin oxidoreductase YrpB (nitropropane dioxygenase family)